MNLGKKYLLGWDAEDYLKLTQRRKCFTRRLRLFSLQCQLLPTKMSKSVLLFKTTIEILAAPGPAV